MGEKDNKISTIVLKVDLECQRCYKKIRRVICKIQDKMDIKTTSFDEKSNTVTISGPFDAEKVCRKLCCHAGRVIKDMNIQGKDKPAGDKPAATKPAEKPKEVKEADIGPLLKKLVEANPPPEKKEGKAEKAGKDKDKDGGKADKAEKPKDAKPDKKVTFEGDDAKPEKKAAKAIPQADVNQLLKKMAEAKVAGAGPEPPRGEPVAAQGVAVPSIWPAPASSLAGYGYNPSYVDPSYYGASAGGYGYGCGCGYGGAYCRCGKPAAPAGGYYGVPVYDNQGWYYGGGRQPAYYPQQQSCCEDPNAGCSVM